MPQITNKNTKKLIVFNWKMNPTSLEEAKKLFALILTPKTSALPAGRYNLKPNLVICPPFIYSPIFSSVSGHQSSVKLGAQDSFWENSGAYTGEISAAMLKNLGVKYVIVGHSERRNYLGETDEMINKKVKAALGAGLKVILCVGESLKIRKKAKKVIKNFIKNQLQKDLKGLSRVKSQKSNVIVAYEPRWAIGTGNYCQPEDALEIIKFIKNFLNSKFIIHNSRVLYGGSVTGKNIKEYLKFKEIDGVLVGGASVNQKELKRILNII